MKRKLAIVIIGIICCFLLFGRDLLRDPQDAEIIRVHADYIIDVKSLPELAANVDYIMVGKVLKEQGKSYKGFGGTDIYTRYSVEVVENLKGELRQDKPITITKAGGVTRDRSKCVLYESDILPVADGTYVFFIHAQSDGCNLASGANSNIPLDATAFNTKLSLRYPMNSKISSGVVEYTLDTFDKFPYETKIQMIVDAINMDIPATRKPAISNDDVSVKK